MTDDRSHEGAGGGGETPRVTVVICTLAPRRHYLKRNFDCLVQSRGVEHEEIMVVAEDQAYLDEVQAEWGERLPVVCAQSDTPGLSDKRNVGVERGRGEIIAYLDDDAMAPPEYFEAIHAVFDAGAKCVAGAVEPVFEADLPERMRESAFRIGGFNRWNGEEKPGRWMGANCLFLKEVLVEAGPFDTRFGPFGKLLPWGDDAEMFRRMDSRYGMTFAPSITIRHHIQPERLTDGYVLTRGYKTGRTLCVIDRLHQEDFWKRARIVPVMWLKALLGVPFSGFSFASRLKLRNLTGYVVQMFVFATRGVTSE